MKTDIAAKYQYQAHHALCWVHNEYEKQKVYEALDYLKGKTGQGNIEIRGGLILAHKPISKKWIERFFFYCEGLFAANFFEE